MKTIIITLLTVITSFTLNAGPNSLPAVPSLPDEAYVDDIPFDTREVVANMAVELEAEPNVNDIPFDTRKVVLSYNIKTDIEEYADDFPFDTRQVVLSWVPEVADDVTADDIPFDTGCVTYQVRNNQPVSRCFVIEKDNSSYIDPLFNYDELVSVMVNGIGRYIGTFVNTFLFML